MGKLHRAAEAGNLDEVKSILSGWFGPSVDAWDDEDNKHLRQTALMLAVRGGHLHIVQYLVEERKASLHLGIHDRDRDYPPLLCAAANGYLSIVKYLIEKSIAWDANHALSVSSHFGPLHVFPVRLYLKDAIFLAAKNGHFPVVKYLVEEHKVDVNGRNRGGATLLLVIAGGPFKNVRHYDYNKDHIDKKGYLSIVKYLIEECKVDVNQRCLDTYVDGECINEGRVSPMRALTDIFIKQEPSIMRSFAERFIEDHIITNEGMTALLFAVGGHHDLYLPIVKYLIEEQGCQFDIRNRKGENVFSFARDPLILEYLKTVQIKNMPVVSIPNTTLSASSSASQQSNNVSKNSQNVPANNFTMSLIDNYATAITTHTTPPTAIITHKQTTTTKPTPLIPSNSLLTKPALQQHLDFLKTLPQASLNTLETLGQQGENLNTILPVLSALVVTQTALTQRLQSVEIQAGLDAQTLAEIAYIKKHEHLHRYYQALKTTLGQTFLATKVIASGEVDATEGTATTVANRISTVAGALCPPAAPFLSFAAVVIGIGDGIASSRATHTLSGWTDMEAMAFVAANVARQLTLAQEHLLTTGLNAQAEKNLQYFQEKCSAFIYRIQSGATLTLEEGRAISDANELLSYMKGNNKPKNASPADCVVILLRVIMRDKNYVYVSRYTVSTVQKTSVSALSNTVSNTINVLAVSTTVSDNTEQHPITREEWKAMEKELADAKGKAEEAAKNTASMHQELEALRKKSADSNHTTLDDELDDSNGVQKKLMLKRIANQNKQGAPAISLESLQKQIVALGETVGPMGLIVNQLQEQQNSGIKNNNTRDEQLRQDLFRGSSYNYQQQKNQ